MKSHDGDASAVTEGDVDKNSPTAFGVRMKARLRDLIDRVRQATPRLDSPDAGGRL